MCMQCVTGATVAASATATGLTAWLHTRGFTWLTARRMKVVTACLITFGVLAAGLQV
ncbi:MAG: hypothetical protein QG596_719 [Actinomycetota bacterium]|nr:hypothetical protein [Actinomycetota bacterium]